MSNSLPHPCKLRLSIIFFDKKNLEENFFQKKVIRFSLFLKPSTLGKEKNMNVESLLSTCKVFRTYYLSLTLKNVKSCQYWRHCTMYDCMKSNSRQKSKVEENERRKVEDRRRKERENMAGLRNIGVRIIKNFHLFSILQSCMWLGR